MKTIGTYSFLPWIRQGVANIIKTADKDPNVKARAAVDVSLTLTGQSVTAGAPALTQILTQTIALHGPGDILRLQLPSIVRTEPRDWITNYESNYLPAVDFYDEDAPWRFTPAAHNGLRLRPWITLVVLAEGEFTEGKSAAGSPLPFINVTDATLFPPADDLWAWAHVHFNQSLSTDPAKMVAPDMSAVLPLVQSLISQNPDVAYSRLLCPRRLAESTSYHAFIMPTFETGRLAGLGEAPDQAPYATFSAWGMDTGYTKPQSGNYAYYHRWYFRTGDLGDFEYLVRLLKPQPLDPRVGVRDMDVQDPGSNIPGITIIPGIDPARKGILPLGGALRVPDADLDKPSLDQRNAYDHWDQPYPHPFQQGLAKFINLPDDYANPAPGASASVDPLITAPLYGRWHALTQRLLLDRTGGDVPNEQNWVHKLNLDPRFRVPAGFGADVVETNAEEYMNDAWEQIGDVLAANARIRRLKLAMEVSARWYQRTLQPLVATNFERAFAITAPVAGRVLLAGKTIAYMRSASLVPPVYTSTAMRRVIRPGARLMRSLPFSATTTPNNLLARVNAGEVTAAPPKVVPAGVTTVDQVAAAAAPANVPAGILDLLAKYPWLPNAVLMAAILLAIVLSLLLWPWGIALGLAVVGAGIYFRALLTQWQTADAPHQEIEEAHQTPAAVDQLPKSPDFVLMTPGSTVTPTVGITDSPTAVRFKAALRDSFSLITATAKVSQRPVPIALDLARVSTTVITAIDPTVTIPRRGLTAIAIPDWIRQLIGDSFNEVMAYPKIDLPMYKPLTAEKLLPNISLIPNNSITLIETNQKFIESYMVGLNHEFARKLLWREYPTDQRGSYFRQFWDPRTNLNTDQLAPDLLKEQQYDIPELHRWPTASTLGTHNNRVPNPPGAEQAVLIIRGELLKKYPTAVIYAHHAKWGTTTGGVVDPTLPRDIDLIDDAFEQNPPTTIIRTPIFEAKVDPDIYFFGFDLTVKEAKGGSKAEDDAGWFFVIKQRPGEPRFGLEISRDPDLEVTDELTWDDATPVATAGKFLSAGSLDSVMLKAPPNNDNQEKTEQYTEDKQIADAEISAARWAYILFRSPVMVAVHAADMLRSFT